MSSPLRAALRSRLTVAMRERDREATAVLRSAVAAIENAEAVPVVDLPTSTTSASTTSAEVAGSALGVGAAEAARRDLDAAAERAVVLAEVAALVEAEQVYAAAGDATRAQSASAGVAVLESVLESSSTTRPTSRPDRSRRPQARCTSCAPPLASCGEPGPSCGRHAERLWTRQILFRIPLRRLGRSGIEISHALLSGRAGQLGDEGPHSGATRCGSQVTWRPGPERKSSRSGASHRPITQKGP